MGRKSLETKRCTMRVPVTFKFQVETGAKAQGKTIPQYLEDSVITIRDKEVSTKE